MDNENKNIKPTEQISFVGVGIGILIIIVLTLIIDLKEINEWVKGAGVWAPLLFIVLKISTVVIAPLSGSALYPVVGLLFGFWPGILYIVIGDFLGYTISFYISRFFGRKIVNKLISNNEEGIISRIVDHIGTTKGFLQACMTLFAMPELLSYSAGLSRLSFFKFISILMPLSIVASSILVYFGSLLNPNGSYLAGILLPAAFALIILFGGTLFLKSVSKRKE